MFDDKAIWETFFPQLSSKEHEILLMRFQMVDVIKSYTFDDDFDRSNIILEEVHTLEECANHFQITPEEIWSIEKKVLNATITKITCFRKQASENRDVQYYKELFTRRIDDNAALAISDYVIAHLSNIKLQPHGNAMTYLLNTILYQNPELFQKCFPYSINDIFKAREEALRRLTSMSISEQQKQNILQKTLAYIREGEEKYNTSFPYPEITTWISDQITLDDHKISQEDNL